MKIKFQAKIIFGSIIGIISTCITVVVVFFPNLLNMQVKKINEFSISLETEKDFSEFVNFLIDNQERIVRLNLKYYEEERYKFSEKNPNSKELLDREIDHDYEGTELFGEIDPSGHIIVSSMFKHLGPYMRSLHRYTGGFGIWIRTEADNEYIDKNYFIIIPKSSEGNTLYQWNLGNSLQEMILSGTFYVESMVPLLEYDNVTSATMSTQFSEQACKSGKCYGGSFVIDLNPLSKKELEMLKY